MASVFFFWNSFWQLLCSCCINLILDLFRCDSFLSWWFSLLFVVDLRISSASAWILSLTLFNGRFSSLLEVNSVGIFISQLWNLVGFISRLIQPGFKVNHPYVFLLCVVCLLWRSLGSFSWSFSLGDFCFVLPFMALYVPRVLVVRC